MGYKSGESYYGYFTTQKPDGTKFDAASLPTATAARNGADDGSFTLTVANIATGLYKVTGTIPAGYVSGDVVAIRVIATVDGTAGQAVLDQWVLDSKRVWDLSDIDPSADLGEIKAIVQAGRVK